MLLGLSLAATGCSFSSVDPNADVHVSGRALDASGKPLAQAKVLLLKEADIGEVLFGSILAVGTLSTICYLPDPPALCAKARTATTDNDGRYAFELSGEDTQGTLGTESTMNVVFSGGQGKASTTISFTAKETEISLPDARLWDSRARASVGAGNIGISWSALPATAGGKVGYSALLFEADGAAALWTQPASGTSAALDARFLEDRRGSVAVNARADLKGASGAGDVRANFLSPRLGVRATTGAPPSRGRRCAPVTGTGPAVTGRFGRCALTNGDLDAPARLTGKGVVVGATIDLGSRRPIRLVVARGFSGQLLLEVSDDGQSYQIVATGSGASVGLEPHTTTSARYVRLRSPAGVDQSLAAEISVW